MKAEKFFSQFNLNDEVQSILVDLVYNDQICGPSNEDEEQDMERTAKLAVYSLLNSSYADKNGEIEVSNVDFDSLHNSMYNAIFKEFNHICNVDDDYDDYDDYDDGYGTHYGEYAGSYAQDVMGYSDDVINDAFDGDPDAYWNID